MAKIRHIAYRAVDVDAMAKFFVDAMGMTMIQKRKNNAIDLSDGSGEHHSAAASRRAWAVRPVSITSVFPPTTIRNSSGCLKPPARPRPVR